MVVHGNNKSDEELAAAAAAGALVVLDSLEEIDRARAAGVARTLIRVTPGIEADTHEKIRTGHLGSKFGLTPDDSLEALRRAPEIEGLHVHIGSQLRDLAAARTTVEWVAAFAARARAETGWELRTLDLGGGLGVAATPDEAELTIHEFTRSLLDELERAAAQEGLSQPKVILEPGRSLTARAGVTLYTVGSVKTSGDSTAYVAVDGGMSDNPRPALYGARYTAVLADRADEPTTRAYTIVGKHCESGDLLIESVELPQPRRGDILAVPATGAYTLAMSSTYNAVPRPAAVLLDEGNATIIRRRETIDDLLALEPGGVVT
jgi:diaminopimelate decarboxylase